MEEKEGQFNWATEWPTEPVLPGSANITVIDPAADGVKYYGHFVDGSMVADQFMDAMHHADRVFYHADGG